MSVERLEAESRATGFRVEMLEKVARLMGVLEGVRAHPFLRDRLALKGGTALNLFIFDVPRLSIDIDLNYLGTGDREQMMDERPKVERALEAVFSRENLQVRAMPVEHAGGKWWLRYESSRGRGGALEVDVNFMYRLPLWQPRRLDSRLVGRWRVKDVLVMDIHELVAGKLCALLARQRARDLFDSHQLLSLDGLDPARLRIAFVVYGAMSRRDWRQVSIEDVGMDPAELANQLLPVLRHGALKGTAETAKYGPMLVEGCQRLLSVVLPLTDKERAFLDLLLDRGQVDASLLTSDESLRERVRGQPLLRWKSLNVRRRAGSGARMAAPVRRRP